MNFSQFKIPDTVQSLLKIMANKNEKLPVNVPGKYYVDNSCIDCDLCRDTLPSSFKLDHALGMTFVHRQPESVEELALAEEAKEGCPVEAIGNDGL